MSFPLSLIELGVGYGIYHYFLKDNIRKLGSISAPSLPEVVDTIIQKKTNGGGDPRMIGMRKALIISHQAEPVVSKGSGYPQVDEALLEIQLKSLSHIPPMNESNFKAPVVSSKANAAKNIVMTKLMWDDNFRAPVKLPPVENL